MECDRNLYYTALQNGFSCKECEDMRRDESPIVDKDAEQVWNKAIDEVIEIIEKEIESCEARYQLGEFMPDVCALLRVGTVVKGMKGGEWG